MGRGRTRTNADEFGKFVQSLIFIRGAWCVISTHHAPRTHFPHHTVVEVPRKSPVKLGTKTAVFPFNNCVWRKICCIVTVLLIRRGICLEHQTLVFNPNWHPCSPAAVCFCHRLRGTVSRTGSHAHGSHTYHRCRASTAHGCRTTPRYTHLLPHSALTAGRHRHASPTA